jgi:hypothetical protein
MLVPAFMSAALQIINMTTKSPYIFIKPRLELQNGIGPFLGDLMEAPGECKEEIFSRVPDGQKCSPPSTRCAIKLPADVPSEVPLTTEECVNAAVCCPVPLVYASEKERNLSLEIERIVLSLQHLIVGPDSPRINFVLGSSSDVRKLKFHCEADVILVDSESQASLRPFREDHTDRYNSEVNAIDKMSL